MLQFPEDIPWLPTSGNAYTTKVLHKILPIPEDHFRILADFYLSYITPLYGDVHTLEQGGACYRVHGANNFEKTELNIRQVRQSIIHWQATHKYINTHAANIGLLPTTHGIQASVTYLAHRMISLKLEPHNHPLVGDTAMNLLCAGKDAAIRRFDVRWPMKLLFISWFIAMAFAPPTIARWLSEQWLFPEKRQRFNILSTKLHLSR
jgi:hypothetical protein